MTYAVELPAVLVIRVIEGEGVSYARGSRATRGLTVLVTDEAGHPVDGASVSFSLPMDGPGGVFSTGSRTEIATTHSDGRAAVWGMRWNRTPGAFQIRITAMKGQARANVLSSQFLSEGQESKSADLGKAHAGGHKLLWISVIAAGAAAAGIAGVMAGKGSTSTSGTAVVPLQIGAPTISLGHS